MVLIYRCCRDTAFGDFRSRTVEREPRRSHPTHPTEQRDVTERAISRGLEKRPRSRRCPDRQPFRGPGNCDTVIEKSKISSGR